MRPSDEILKESLPFGMLIEPAVIEALKQAKREAIIAAAGVASSQGERQLADLILNLLNDLK